ncbi:MAG TPA: nuclear transport factor 2 family protein [Acetobacteraceae bacterium]|nr:nuclear transport factor 2 family protein [Acetobacteraceae bacterium]
MSHDNAAIIRRFYDTFDPAILDPEVEWTLAEGFHLSGTWRGPRAVLEEWWPRHAARFSATRAIPERFVAEGDTVVTLGRYEATVKDTGQRLDIPFAHVWTLREGRVIAFRQHTDTLLFAQALGARAAA